MSIRTLNGLNGSNTNVVITNRMLATSPLEMTQTLFTDPIVMSLKGLSGVGNNGQVIKSNGSSLYYATDAGSNWTISGSNIYPTTATQVLVNTNSNPNNYGIFLLDKEIAIKTSAGSGSSQGLRIINDTNSVINYVDNTGNMFWSGAVNTYNFSKKLVLNFTGAEFSNGTNDFTLPSSTGTIALFSQIPTNNNQLTNGANYITSASIPTNNNQLTNGAGYITSSSLPTNNNQLTNGAGYITSSSLPTNNNQLTNGAGYITSSAIGTNLLTATNFGTTATGIISLGNSAGTSATASLKLYGNTFNLYNTSNVNVATFTPVSNTCNLDLKGGLLTTFTASTNALWNGSVITDQYGGTGLTSYTVGDMLYVAGGIQPAGSLNKLAIGSTNQVLTVVGGVPAWANPQGGGIWSRSSTTITPVNSGDTIDLLGETLLAYLIQGSGYNNECALRMGYYGSNELRGQITSGNRSYNLTLRNTYNDTNTNTDYTKYPNIGVDTSKFVVNMNGVGDALICKTNLTTQIPSGSFEIGTDAEHYKLETNFTNNTFEIKEQDGTVVMKYDADTGYTDWCATAGARMDFKYNVLHGSEPAYPQGVNMPFGALSTMYGSAAYIKSITTDEINVSEYNGNPATVSRYIRCNSSGRIYNQGNAWVGSFYGTQSQNYLEEYTTYGFQLRGTYYTSRSYNLWLINSGTGSNGGIIGCENEGMFIHMNGLGDAFKVYSENSKACCKVVNALRIDGFISTAGNSLSGNQTDGTCLSTYVNQPYSNSYWQQFGGSYNSFPYWDLWGTDYDPANINSTGVGLVCERGVFFKSGALFIACDKRLKHNITEIDDKYALDTLNKINMYRFKYKDCFNNNDEYVYNVIAQEVAEHFPQGVNYHKDFLPDIMSSIIPKFEPFTRERLVKGENDKPDKTITDNIFKMTFDINEKWEKDYIQKGKKYRFYCGNNDTDFTNSKYETHDLECGENNSFIIEKEYKYVLLYGVEVNDLMSVDKQKLHSLQHSAIQELHKQNVKQQEEIDTLKEQVKGMNEILNKLINSKSFVDFKKNVA